MYSLDGLVLGADEDISGFSLALYVQQWNSSFK